jgi:ribonuclease-3
VKTEKAREDGLRALEARLGHRFKDRALLERALTHTSRANENLQRRAPHNEPFEFLGDAILGFLVAELLHHKDPEGEEGRKTRARAALVSAAALARRAAALELPELILLGRGEEKSGGRKKAALWADAYEAVIAALYLDGGMEPARRFVESEIGADLLKPAVHARDFKSALQERLQARGSAPPDYVVVEEEGPAHRKRYRVECRVEGRSLATGEGHSKKEAQQDAARKALDEVVLK